MDQFDLARFKEAHQRDYHVALAEVKNGRKLSHWMWYIFPILSGLARSYYSQFYAISSAEEAIAYSEDPYLGGHLVEICSVLLDLHTNNAREVFGKPDDWKLKASMTLFSVVSREPDIYEKVLEKYFHGRKDDRTMRALGL